MIDLQNLKNAINDGGFSEEAKALMLPIVEVAIAKGSMTTEEKKKLQDIMDVEVDKDVLEQGANEEAAEMIETFLAEADAATQTAAGNMEALNTEAEEDAKKIKDDLANASQVQPGTAPIEAVPLAAAEQSQQETAQPEVPPLQVHQAETPWQPPTQ